MKTALKLFIRARDGVVMVEFTIVLFVLLVVTLGMVDFSMALYQWNTAAKATELGARQAAVSGPVAGNLSDSIVFPPTNAFVVVCNGSLGSCTGGGTYSASALQTIVFGRGKTSCSAVATDQLLAMCNVFPNLTTSNVKVTYQQSAYNIAGLGYNGKTNGPVPTITVETTGLTFSFFFLNTLLGFPPKTVPALRTTITAEDLSSSCVVNQTC